MPPQAGSNLHQADNSDGGVDGVDFEKKSREPSNAITKVLGNNIPSMEAQGPWSFRCAEEGDFYPQAHESPKVSLASSKWAQTIGLLGLELSP